jgi:hypothetical protein
LILIQHTLTLAIIISLALPLQYQTLLFANGQIQEESNIIIYDDTNPDHGMILPDDSNSYKNTMLKPKVDVSIEGTSQKDKIRGGEGDDYLYGDNGSDQLRGEAGNDEIDGGKGNDILHGEDGDDKINGNVGNDRISGGLGDDQIEGENGDDKLFGGDGDDLLDGGEGNDVLLGGRGVDIMIGGFGQDTFVCDQFDKLMDFNQYEGDEIIGSCLDEYLVEDEEKDIEEKPAFNNNIFPLEVEEFDRFSTPQSSLSQPSQKSPNYLSQPLPPMDSFEKPFLTDEDLQRIPPPPMPSTDF